LTLRANEGGEAMEHARLSHHARVVEPPQILIMGDLPRL
jgi:hypothetical protein